MHPFSGTQAGIPGTSIISIDELYRLSPDLPKLPMNVSRLKALEWKAGTTLEQGLHHIYQWFLDHQVHLRG